MESSSYVFKQTEYEQWHNINISLAALFNNYHLGCMTPAEFRGLIWVGITAVSGVEGNQGDSVEATRGCCMGAYFFLKNRYISHFSHFMPKIKYFAENEEKIQKSKIMNQK